LPEEILFDERRDTVKNIEIKRVLRVGNGLRRV